ncbi:MAG TPA: hypothetical protein DDW82_00310 [Acholeplasmataceae bacterium]|nr:hypothetical protein [Acholeplasmataceae bacterium]HCB66769.1 hypothetical protein [Acholeplasmataceae bacterium]
MTTIGKRSTGELFLLIIVMLFIIPLGFLMFSLYMRGDMNIQPFHALIGVISLVVIILYVFLFMSKPKELIKHDFVNLYIEYQSSIVAIPLSDIESVISRRSSGEAFHYTFGKIIIKTKRDRYKIGHVGQCEQVAIEILKLRDSVR